MSGKQAPLQCKLKKRCPNQCQELHNCWSEDCNGFIHELCAKMSLDKHNIPLTERPTEDDRETPDKLPVLFCTKACHGKWKAMKKRQQKAADAAAKEAEKKKRKVPWEDDGSMDVLLDWLTTHGNCESHAGANGHQNKGKSKSAHHKETSLLIQEKKPESERNEKDVENKIGSLERQFRVARDWANNTGQGVSEPGQFEDAVKQRCKCHCQLEDVMGKRPNAQPLFTNEDSDSFELPVMTTRKSQK